MPLTKLADLSVINPQNLRLLSRAEMQPRRQVEDEQYQGRHEERVHPAGNGIGQLVAQLDPVVVDPASGDDGHAVKVRDVVGREEGGQDVAHEPADAVHRKDVQRVVDLEQELELRAVVGEGCAEHAERDGCPDWYISWRRQRSVIRDPGKDGGPRDKTYLTRG